MLKVFTVEYRPLVARGAQKKPVMRPICAQTQALAQERAICAQKAVVRRLAGLSVDQRLNWARA